MFNKNNIPILTSNGNHDLDRNLISNEKQFNIYIDFIYNNLAILNCELSSKFQSDQSSYIYLKEENCLFISINSCVNIENKNLYDEKGHKTNLLDESYQIVGIPSIENLNTFLEEIKAKIGKKYDYTNKFLICHHPMRDFEKSERVIYYFIENRFLIIFSGHIHTYDMQKRENLLNFVAGSVAVNVRQRFNPASLAEYPKQFNLYKVIESDGKIVSYNYFELYAHWEYNEKHSNYIQYTNYHTLDNWCEKYKLSNEKCNKLKKLNIIGIYEFNKSDMDYNMIFYTLKENFIICFLLNKSDTQLKVDAIKKWIIINEQKINSKEISFRIVINGSESLFMNQLPTNYII